MTNKKQISLSDMIQTLREELEISQARATNSSLNLKVDAVEIELSVAITSSATGKAGVKFWVVEAGAEAKQEDASTHKFKLTLKPYTNSGDILVSDTSSDRPSRN